MKEKLAELEELLKQSEAHRQELEQSHRLKDQQLTAALSTAKVFHDLSLHARHITTLLTCAPCEL